MNSKILTSWFYSTSNRTLVFRIKHRQSVKGFGRRDDGQLRSAVIAATALIAFTQAGNRPRLHRRVGRGLRANKFFLLPCGGLCVFAPQR